MPITVLYYDREGCETLSAITNEAARLICVSTQADFCSRVDDGDVNLVVLAESVEWQWREAVCYLDEKLPDIPRLLLLEQENASIRREALLVGIWQTIARDEIDVLRATLRLHTKQAVSLLVSGANKEALAASERVLEKSQKSIALGVLLGSIAHEINNPLEGLGNLLYLARRSKDDQDNLQVCLDMAEAELSRVSEITKQMLSFHRDSKTPEDVSLADLLDGILVLFAAKLRERQITIVRQFDCPGWMVAHPGELRQAFVNLISNAIDAMPNGGRLTLRVRERAGSNPCLCISVADTGQGMAPAFLEQFGELFATTKGQAGTGLGGWVTRRVTKKYGGDFRIYSCQRAGRSGTVIRLCFPHPHAKITGNTKWQWGRTKPERSGNTPEQDGLESKLRSA
jgi:signal transduction histidine kinase